MKKIFFILVLCILSINKIFACSVIPDYPNKHLDEYKNAKAIFIGQVIDVSIYQIAIKGKTLRSDTLYKIRFKIVKSWKYKMSEITLISDNGTLACGKFTFKKGKKYLVYANTFEDKLAVWATVGNPSQPFDSKDFITQKRLNELNTFRSRIKSKTPQM